MSLFDVGLGVSWGEVLLLEAALANDPATHYGSAVAGFAWPAAPHDVASAILAQAVLSFLMPEGKSVSLPMPWDRDESVPPPAEVVEEMRARLQEYSAFRD